VEPLSADDFRELRRIRRLQELGVNWAGIEIILNMRRRLLAMQAERTYRVRTSQWSGLSAAGDLWQRRLPWEPDQE
jgi:DNA-binding transcriptional MerR regulator